ncbi:EamA family transporter [Bdellovibrio bacteriovorus]|uniref:EamA family transporter n=1 Tax=Bdellovibrio bacteriovorus TaxID=959 RepID=UPI0035A8287B
MTLGPLLLLTSAFLHAAWNAVAKSSQDKESFLFLTILLSGIITLGVTLTFGGFSMPHGEAWLIGILSGVFEGLYFLTLAKALRTSSLGKSYTIMRGGAMILVWLISTLFLQERAGGLQFTGAALILAGIIAMNAQDFSKNNAAADGRGNIWAYLSAIFIAGYHLCYHRALVAKAEPKSLFFIAMIVSLPFLFWGLRKDPVSRISHTVKTRGLAVMATGAAATASFLIFLYGLQVSAPGFAISLRNSSIFFAVIFSYFLKESLTRSQILGAFTVGVGAVLLSL